ncbi:phage tail terminator protein [Pararhodospirillum oryzae]|uniref:DUF3168 domain-containing protein n=1 Tax=Pararhodospirillum oryzae TaxID=478448 RepID=A0A512HA15_9PROT|nr:hypothetical protein [Pararhodospirillum oryzae]GEO82272.1 hypothetical protein ROR02_24030 [Pararhodospirillum oryzae]
MIAAPLIPALLPIVAAVPGVRRALEADDLAALVAARDLPQTLPAAYVLVMGEAAGQVPRTVHTTSIAAELAVVLVDRPRATPRGLALGEIGAGVIAALDGRVPAEGWTPIGYRGGAQQVRAAAADRQGAVFLTLSFATSIRLRGAP